MSGMPMGGGGRLLRAPETGERPQIRHLGRRILRLLRPYRGKLILTSVLVVVTAALVVAVPLLTQQLFDRGLFPPSGGVQMDIVWELVGLMLLVSIVWVALGIWRTYITTSVGNNVVANIRTELFGRLQAMDLAFYTRTKTGVIQSRLANDVGGVSGVLTSTIPAIISNVVTVASALTGMIILSWQLTFVALFLMPLLVILQVRIGRIRQEIARQTQESLSEMTAVTQEALGVSGIVLAKVFNQEHAETERYAAENRRQVRLQIKQQMTGQRFFGAVQLVMNATPAIVYLCAGLLITQDWVITAGTIVAFTTLQARVSGPLLSLMRVSLDVQTSQALFARIFEYMDLTPAIQDRPGARVLNPGTVRGEVALEDVTFRYPDAEGTDTPPALQDVSLTIKPGEFAAFVGPSGAGKTSLAYLVPRLYEVTGGRVKVDGQDIRDLTMDSLRAAIGMVTQETYLFHATIAENLRYAKPDATAQELEDAARVANIHERITEFPDGYDTIVGERGFRLSGGEKQRLAIARVVLKNPAILILDEATSALDTVSERVVQEALENVMAGRTTIAIAHRLSTITGADRIFVFQRGHMIESGTHLELLAAGGLYAGLYGESSEPL